MTVLLPEASATAFSKSQISLQRLSYDDPAWHVQLWATNAYFACGQDFYIYPDELRSWAGDLRAFFPLKPVGEVRFELGSQDPKWAYYVSLRAYVLDVVGHVALEVMVDNHARSHGRANASFSIPCDVAAINRLGNQVENWVNEPGIPLIWLPIH